MSSLVTMGRLSSLTRHRLAGTSFRSFNTYTYPRAFLSQTPKLYLPAHRLSRSATTYSYQEGVTKGLSEEPTSGHRSKKREAGIRIIYSLLFIAGIYSGIKMAVDFQLQTDPIRAHILPDPEISPAEVLAIESMINNHSVTEELRKNEALTESRPHLSIPLQFRAQVLTSGVLSGVNRIVVPPFVFADREGKSYTSIQYLGSELCGHPGIIHGGLIATILDEGLARCSFYALPNHIAMTASLEVNYRAPCMADQAVVLKATTTKVEGRKAWVEGRIETMDGKLLADAKALMIEPKNADKLRVINKMLPME